MTKDDLLDANVIGVKGVIQENSTFVLAWEGRYEQMCRQIEEIHQSIIIV